MDQTNTKAPHNLNVNTLIIVGVIVLLAVLFMYLQDRQQDRDMQLRRLEARVELLEEWEMGRSWQQYPQQNLPSPTGDRVF